MRFGQYLRTIAIFCVLIAAGTLIPAQKANAMIVSYVMCENVIGTVNDGDGYIYSYPEVACYEYSYDDGSGGDSGGGGPNGGGSGGNSQVCSFLATTKPDDCPNKVAEPATYDFGFDSFPSGSALKYLIGYANSGSSYIISRNLIKSALKNQTINTAKIFKQQDEVISDLLKQVESACAKQAEFGTSPTATNLCAKGFGRLKQEAGHPNTVDSLVDWMAVNGIDLGVDWQSFSIAISAIMNFFSPDNSLRIKFEKTRAAQQCHDWWQDVEDAGCAT